MLAVAPSPDVSEVRFAFQHSDDQRLLSLLLHALRYAQIMFIDFSRLLCSDGQHFTVLTLTIGSACLPAYRGPDNTLAGWREDLALSCQPYIASPQEVLRYLLHQAQVHPARCRCAATARASALTMGKWLLLMTLALCEQFTELFLIFCNPPKRRRETT